MGRSLVQQVRVTSSATVEPTVVEVEMLASQLDLVENRDERLDHRDPTGLA